MIVADEIVNIVNNDDAGTDREGENKKEGMDDYDSGGRSADKAPGAEDEGSTAPIPEKVVLISIVSFLVFSFVV